MSRVYRGTVAGPHGRRKTDVALKVPKPVEGDIQLTAIAIQNEARVLAVLQAANLDARFFPRSRGLVVGDLAKLAPKDYLASGEDPDSEAEAEEVLAPILVMDWIKGRDLSLVTEKPYGENLRLLALLSKAVALLHDAGVVHGDLKPPNIMVEDPEPDSIYRRPSVRIIDFGISRIIGGPDCDERKGMYYSKHLRAPEIILNQICEPAADVYALGLIILERLTGSPTFFNSVVSDNLNVKELKNWRQAVNDYLIEVRDQIYGQIAPHLIKLEIDFDQCRYSPLPDSVLHSIWCRGEEALKDAVFEHLCNLITERGWSEDQLWCGLMTAIRSDLQRSLIGTPANIDRYREHTEAIISDHLEMIHNPDLRELLRKMLNQEADKRPSAQEVAMRMARIALECEDGSGWDPVLAEELKRCN